MKKDIANLLNIEAIEELLEYKRKWYELEAWKESPKGVKVAELKKKVDELEEKNTQLLRRNEDLIAENLSLKGKI